MVKAYAALVLAIAATTPVNAPDTRFSDGAPFPIRATTGSLEESP